MVVFLAPAVDFAAVVDQEEGPTMCGCGCGNLKGACCCTSPKASGLAFRCQNQKPSDTSEGAVGGKCIGPPTPVTLISPAPSVAELVVPEPAFAGLDPLPETPPPEV
jgi:hypothetical protein